jgi:hypothetical protein
MEKCPIKNCYSIERCNKNYRDCPSYNSRTKELLEGMSAIKKIFSKNYLEARLQ